MPFLKLEEGEQIYYRIYDDEVLQTNGWQGEQTGNVQSRRTPSKSTSRQNGRQGASVGKPLVVLIMGFAAGQEAWTPQLHGLLHPAIAEGGTSVRRLKLIQSSLQRRVLTLDNRGVGRSSCPVQKEKYSTTIMARDVLAVMDHLKWGGAHIVGHSMGGMIAMKLAVLAPERVCSLSVISATGGGWQSLPFGWRATKYMWKAYRAGGTKERAKIDMKFHFMKETLRQFVLGRRRKEMLLEEYTGVPDAAADKPMGQPKWAMKGQLAAIWRHSISSKEYEQLRHATFRKQVVHGRYDILANPKHSMKIAERMSCRLVLLEGAHFVTRECGTEINSVLRAIIFPAQELDPQHYMAPDAGSDIVSTLRAPSLDVHPGLELAATGGMIADVLLTDEPEGDPETASGVTSGGSSTASNMHLLGHMSGSRSSKGAEL